MPGRSWNSSAAWQQYEFTVSTPHGSLLETKNRLFLDMMKYGYHNIFRQVEDVLAEEEVILKIAVYHRGSIRQLGEEVLIPQWGGLVKPAWPVRSGGFHGRSVDKGNALRTLQQFWRCQRRNHGIWRQYE